MRNLITNLLLFFITFFAFATKADAQTPVTAKDTIEFVASKVVMEDDPNGHNYVFSLFSPDGQWKIQINYYADSMFGTFTTADFNLSGSGKNYNYVRNPKNDMQFYSFTEMDVEVTNNVTTYTIKANCLASNKTRYIVEGSVEVAIPTETREYDLGYAAVMKNAFYGTYTLSAENDDFSLKYGIVGDNLIGTFYRADLLMPELVDRHSGDTIAIANATAVHTEDEDGTKHFVIDLISEDLVCYHITMFNAPITVDIKQEINIDLGFNCALQDLTEMYGCYQFGGANDEYGIAVGLTPEAIESGRREWTGEDIFLPYTTIVRFSDNYMPTIHDVKASFSSGEDKVATLRADITCLDGTLYHTAMHLQLPGYVPEPKETIDIDFGRVAVLDHSQGLGTIGIGAVKSDAYQMRLYLNDHVLEGEYTTEDIIPDMCDMLVVTGDTYRFHDAWTVSATATKDADGRTLIDVNMLATDTIMYHATMFLDPLECMQDKEYRIDAGAGVTMLAIQEGKSGDYAEYTLQFQALGDDYDPEVPITDGYVFSFYFPHTGEGIAGEYGYSEGTLADDESHMFFENGTEVRVAPVAGTLSITPRECITIDFADIPYQTTIYDIDFKFVGQNGVVYTAKADNLLICIDADGYLLELKEPALDSITATLADHGYAIRKVLRDGHILIESAKNRYDLSGKKQ